MGKVDELLEGKNETQLLTTKLDENVVQEIEAVLTKHNARMIKVDHPRSNLEDLFLRTVQQSIDRPGQRYVPDSETSSEPPSTTDGNGETSETNQPSPSRKDS